MAFNINQIQASFQFDGARASLFEVRLSNPIVPGSVLQVPFRCRAAEIPGVEQNIITVGYFGRQINYAANKTFTPWTITLYEDEDYQVRDGIEQWMASMNTHRENIRESGPSTLSYKSDAQVIHYGKQGNVIREYRIEGMFPTSLAPIPLAWDNDTFAEYSVTFAIDYWTVDAGPTGSIF